MRQVSFRWLLILCMWIPSIATAQDVPNPYKDYFEVYQPRDWKENLLNGIGLSKGAVGRSYALVAGVSDYAGTRNDLKPAAEDIRKVVAYLKDVELFDEVVVLQNDAMTPANMRYFLRVYFPQQLRGSPKSRFLFAYSGHGNEDNDEGYLLLRNAQSLSDRQHSIDMTELRLWVDRSIRSAHQSLVLINACHSGAFFRRPFGDEEEDLGVVLPSEPGAHAITASGTNERAWHVSSVGSGSVFFEKFSSRRTGASRPVPDASGGWGGAD